jgi:copper homeostasis protein
MPVPAGATCATGPSAPVAVTRTYRSMWDDATVPETILEVIALDAVDARAAEEGGADRIELVTDIAAQGLTPAVETFAAVRAVTSLPVRVMLRSADGFAIGDPAVVTGAARDLRAAGADEFVLGFLGADDRIDLAAVETVLAALDGCRWTFHRAIDFTADRAGVWAAIAGLPGLDQVLTSGSPDGVTAGLETLTAEASSRTPAIMAGGGLRRQHIAPLRAAGIRTFHTGAAVRPAGSWDKPIDPALVSAWRALLDQPADRSAKTAPG